MEYVTAGDLEKMGWSSSRVTPTMVADLNSTLERYHITSPEKIEQFIAQCSQESGLGRYTTEQGSAAYFQNKEYGEKYRGAGYLQMTGKANYEAFAKVVNDPEVVNQGANYVAEHYPWSTAGVWWEQNHMNSRIDSMVEKNMPASDRVDEVSRVVNAGPGGSLSHVNGLEERHTYYDRAVENHIGTQTQSTEPRQQDVTNHNETVTQDAPGHSGTATGAQQSTLSGDNAFSVGLANAEKAFSTLEQTASTMVNSGEKAVSAGIADAEKAFSTLEQTASTAVTSAEKTFSTVEQTASAAVTSAEKAFSSVEQTASTVVNSGEKAFNAVEQTASTAAKDIGSEVSTVNQAINVGLAALNDYAREASSALETSTQPLSLTNLQSNAQTLGR